MKIRMMVLLICLLVSVQTLVAQSGDDGKVILTPKPGPEAKINGAKLYGVRPGRPVIYRVPASGERPMRFAAKGLPQGLKLDSATGIITGTLTDQTPGEHLVTLEATNAHGTASRQFKFVVGDRIALTPPMGWNSWYIHYHRVSDKLMREAADQMVASGMADFGYSYVNIDDGWMRVTPENYQRFVRRRKQEYDNTKGVVGRTRDDEGNILTNVRFPDMKALTDYIHAKGLRAGLYSSPGLRTCQEGEGCYGHERQDAEQYAAWGFDFFKYDLCFYCDAAKKPCKGRAAHIALYKKMGDILKTLDRDIVYNVCQYGFNDVWEWGCAVGGNCWRTTGDLGTVPNKRLPGFYPIGLRNAELYEYAKPGCWNDPDYILIGRVGDANTLGPGKATELSGDEQYTYMSMWSLMAAPLIFSGDMAQLDEFTLNILCNSEVIDIDQDPLGKQAAIVKRTEDVLILAKPLEDGSMAVGLFNLSEQPRKLTADWAELGLDGERIVRDVWRQQDVGRFDERFSVEVNRHGVSLLRLRNAEQANIGFQQEPNRF